MAAFVPTAIAKLIAQPYLIVDLGQTPLAPSAIF